MSMRGLSCIFPVPDIKKTAEYYVSNLGFSAVEYLNCEEPHICLYLDKIEIVLLQANTDRIQSNRELYGYGYDAYLYTDNQESLEKDFVSKGVNVVRPLNITDYQNREFVIEDIDGRWLAFGLKQSVE
ncbi:VOC family protein [Lachnospiraceae bacterium 46-15]